jgi:hypothetical protein
VIRTLAVALAALALTAGGAAGGAAAAPSPVLPGVTYERQTVLTSHGPVVLHVVVGPRPGGLLTLEPVLSNDAVPDSEPLTSIQRRLSPTATSIGVNGDYTTPNGRPIGLVLRAGALQHGPLVTRASVGVDGTGTLRAARVQLLGTWQGSGQRRPLSVVNESPTGNQLALFTPAWGPTTPQVNGTVEVVVQPFPAAAAGKELSGIVTAVAFGGGSTIPPDGAVLVARGSSATNLRAEGIAIGQTIRVRLILKPDWSDVVDGIGGGPQLVRNGIAVFRPVEGFASADLLARVARSAVGQRSDGAILLVTVDGGRPGYSVGMTSFELAQEMVRLGAIVAVGLGTGPSAALGFEGSLLSRPAVAELPISDALLLVYRGVYVPPLATDTLSPNGDGSADTITVAYKAVRQSQVTATLTGPGGQSRITDQGDRAAQTYSFPWNGLTPAGTPDSEGLYHWTVVATDDLGRQSSMDRSFTLNRTLGALRATAVLRTASGATQPVAGYDLTRTSHILVSFLSPAGAVTATLSLQTLQPGPQVVAWNGRDRNGNPVAPGRYTVRLTAENEIGRTQLTATVVVRRA